MYVLSWFNMVYGLNKYEDMHDFNYNEVKNTTIGVKLYILTFCKDI